MGIASQSVNAFDRGHVQVLYYWMDLNLIKRLQNSFVQALVIKKSTVHILTSHYDAVSYIIL